MKKRICIVIALALTAALLSGCGLLTLLYSTAVEYGVQTRETEEVERYVDEDMAVEDGLAYESMPMLAAGMSMAGGMSAPAFNTEEYASVTENGFRSVATSPLSTFSADVDTASYCNLRRMLNDGWAAEKIPAGAVRVEEMLNYFRYSYPAPEDGARFGVTARLGDCPWNPEATLLMLGVRAADAPE